MKYEYKNYWREWLLLVVFLNQNIFLALHLKFSRFFLGVEVFRTGILWILALCVGINSKRWSGLASISWKEAQLLPTKMMAHFKLLLLLVPGILGQTHFSNFPIFIKDILLTGSNNQFWNYEFWTFTNFLTNQIVFDKRKPITINYRDLFWLVHFFLKIRMRSFVLVVGSDEQDIDRSWIFPIKWMKKNIL